MNIIIIGHVAYNYTINMNLADKMKIIFNFIKR